MVILYGAMGIGMFLLNFSSPQNFQPFILVSVITSVALIPILLTKKKPPTFKRIKAMTLKDLYDASPFGMVSSFFYGTIQAALFTLLAVYATSMNFTILENFSNEPLTIAEASKLLICQSHSSQSQPYNSTRLPFVLHLADRQAKAMGNEQIPLDSTHRRFSAA